MEPQPTPSLFLRGKGTYTASLNPANPVGAIQSIEYTLRSLEIATKREQEKLQQLEANLAAFQLQIAKPFESESRLKELLAKQAELDAALDLHKSDEQAAAAGNESEEIPAD